MVHRGLPDHGPLWKLGRDLLFLAVAAGVASALFILLSLVLRGHVNW
jgi:hypothetical protein